MKRRITLISLLVFTMLLAACGGDSTEEPKPEEEQSFEVTDDEKVDDDEVVAHINGTDVTGDEYNLAYLQTKVQLFQLGEDVDDQDSVRERALDALVERELLKQDAEEKGVEISEEEIDSEIEEIKQEDEEQFKSFLDEYHFTESSFKMQLAFEMLYDKYVAEEFPDIDVSEKEVEEFYQEIKDENEDIGELEDVEDMLKTGLKQEKEGEKMQERIEELKEKAEVDMKI